eukprot:TRINITY_DN7113_c3_g1_i1.p1 TRINITY_DN7113_c3_g1~~TRINITY_DN7113_c3_g1_i1.p1  ORF type:complete len:331 (+),score=31.30 TRINITY_DN7113_c3_g1_i1:68-1060(+)
MPCVADAPPWYPPSSEGSSGGTGGTDTSVEEDLVEEEWDVSVGTRGVFRSAGGLPPPLVYLCCDIEATCDGVVGKNGARHFAKPFENEILEIPIEAVDARTGQCLSDTSPAFKFHTYVDPITPPTPFCTSLTGISDETLATAPKLPEAIRRLESWLRRRRLVPWPMAKINEGEINFIWVTDGCWDFGKFLYHDSQRKGLQYPLACGNWCDVREAYSATWPYERLKAPVLQTMVKGVGLSWVGRPHRGHVDTRNLASLVGVLVRCNPASLYPTHCIPHVPHSLVYPPPMPHRPPPHILYSYHCIRPRVPTATPVSHMPMQVLNVKPPYRYG